MEAKTASFSKAKKTWAEFYIWDCFTSEMFTIFIFVEECVFLPATKKLVHALVFCNSLFVGVSAQARSRLQNIINSENYITPVLASLHWLVVSFWINLKILLLTHKTAWPLHIWTGHPIHPMQSPLEWLWLWRVLCNPRLLLFCSSVWFSTAVFWLWKLLEFTVLL